MVSPLRTITAPFACLAILPLSKLTSHPAASTLQYFFISSLLHFSFPRQTANGNLRHFTIEQLRFTTPLQVDFHYNFTKRILNITGIKKTASSL
jgi:hypothetical protein